MNDARQIAAEQRNLASHAHRADSQHHGKEDHLSGHESSRQAMEHTNKGYLETQTEHQNGRFERFTHEGVREAAQHEIAALAFQHWRERSCPEGSPDDDWFRAVEELSGQARASG